MSAAHIILEEIALDGLDGVTVEGLWFRLERTTPKFPIKLDPKSKAYLWKNVIIKLKDVCSLLPTIKILVRLHNYLKIVERDMST